MPTLTLPTDTADLDIMVGQPFSFTIEVTDYTLVATTNAKAYISQWFEGGTGDYTRLATMTCALDAGCAKVSLTEEQVNTMKTTLEALSSYTVDNLHNRIRIGWWSVFWDIPAPVSEVRCIGQGWAYLLRHAPKP